MQFFLNLLSRTFMAVAGLTRTNLPVARGSQGRRARSFARVRDAQHRRDEVPGGNEPAVRVLCLGAQAIVRDCLASPEVHATAALLIMWRRRCRRLWRGRRRVGVVKIPLFARGHGHAHGRCQLRLLRGVGRRLAASSPPARAAASAWLMPWPRTALQVGRTGGTSCRRMSYPCSGEAICVTN